MSAIGDFLAREFGDSNMSFSELRSALVKREGSITGAAKAAGVDRRTWQRWATGSQPKPGTVDRLRYAAAKPSTGGDSLKVLGRNGARTVKLRPGTLDKAQKAYVARGSKAAEAELIGGVQDGWYQQYLSGEAGDDNDSIGSPEHVSF